MGRWTGMSGVLAFASAVTAEPSLCAADSDEALMARIAAGDERAFERLLSRHLDRIHHYLGRLTGHWAECDDLAQETFIKVWLKARSFRPGRVRVTTWLHRIAHNVAVDFLRKAGRATRAEASEPARDEAGPDALGQQAEERQRLHEALSALPENQRSAILLRHQQGLSNPETAAVLGTSVRAVESLLSRGRRRLRALMDQPGNVRSRERVS